MRNNLTIAIEPPAVELPIDTATVLFETVTNWRIIGINESYAERPNHPLVLADALEAENIFARWQSTTAVAKSSCREGSLSSRRTNYQSIPKKYPPYHWPEKPTILALIPHWNCEAWLTRALMTMAQQTHPLTHIVVIDDASVHPPLEIVQAFPTVTLLQSPVRVGPYRLIQSVIDRVDYTAFLFQDADDWSSCDRLEILLKTARQQGAEIAGGQEIRVLDPEQRLQAVGYPLDVNSALAKKPGHALLHPTSLVTSRIIQQIGGFATGLRFGGDTEFLLRAHWQARIVNCDRYCYFRRKRPHSLTTAAETGLNSPARQTLLNQIKRSAIARIQSAALNQWLDLRPLSKAPPVDLQHLCGPSLRWRT